MTPEGSAALLSGSARFVVALGPGGVGKTTTAAALALKAAQAGKQALVCTIDPAQRLAQALGLSGLADEPTPVTAEHFTRRELPPVPGLYAMMLDPAPALDRLLLQSSEDPALIEQLRSHALYQTMVRELPGMHEYAAVSQLYELREGPWDLVVLDTPPTTHALDFLDAPTRLIRALESPAIQWLVRPYLRAGRLSLKMLGGARAYVLRRLAQVVGIDLLERMAEFLALFDGVLDGVKVRTKAVSALLQSAETAYGIVTVPTSVNVAETVSLARQLARRRLAVDWLVCNRIHSRYVSGDDNPEAIAEALSRSSVVGTLPAEGQIRLLEELTVNHRRFQRLAVRDERQIDELLRQLPTRPRVAQIPLMAEDIHDLDGLWRVASCL